MFGKCTTVQKFVVGKKKVKKSFFLKEIKTFIQ